ncbi:hypothetical protein EXIGLDRAFT_727644 [Exidia glandulosa HHB12029]|uniref:Capsule polysaccharide biosynthesis protein n=1 Tax=Exidia glandulosa HHB12029 TaxID=1314781 RepID=A0A165LZX2_EXIGL|nr:hypothetical protein EXIGLDRAFT_727644 [Exidia glandulosa HHB12029]
MAHLPPGTFTSVSSELVPTSRPFDARSDDEIFSYVLSHRPVTHQKNVWAFWDKGWENVQGWKKQNVVGWVRRLGPEWEVRVLDLVDGSPRHIKNFIDEGILPPTYYKMNGRHSGQHRSDILRVLLLHAHGGFWIDIGGILTRSLDDLWSKLADPADPVELVGLSPVIGGHAMHDRPLGNTFLGSQRGNVFLLYWHRVFSTVMSDRTDTKDVRLHPLFAHLTPYELPGWGKEVVLDANDVSDYMPQFHAAGRLFALEDPTVGWDGPRYLQEKTLLLTMDEMFVHNLLTGFNGERQFAYLSAPYTDGEEGKEAREFVETTLARTTIIKLAQGIMPEPVQLATLWDRAENKGADNAPGTWAEYLRWGCVHLDQTREVVAVPKEEKQVQSTKVWTAGILEVIDGKTPVRPTVVL